MPVVDLTEVLFKGIRPTDAPNGRPGIASLKGLACRPEGLMPVEYPSDPLAGAYGTVYGENLLPEGDFASNGSWVRDGWVISLGVAIKSTPSGTLTHSVNLPAGTYRVEGTVIITPPSASTYLTITLGEWTSDSVTTTSNVSFDVTVGSDGAADIVFFGTGNDIRLTTFSIYSTISYDFPFPNLFVGQFGRLVGLRNQLLGLNDAWDSFEMEVYDADATSTPFQVLEGGTWDFAEIGQNWIATNGVSVVWRQSASYPLILGRNNRAIGTTCVHRGRVLFGGFSDDPYNAALYYNQNTDLYGAKDKRAVCWTAYGAPDVWAYLMSGTLTDNYKDQLLRTNEGGYLLLPIEQGVLRLLPGGASVFAYTEDGVFRLPFIPDPPMYGIELVSSACVYRREAVAGDDTRHLFLDTTGRLHLIDRDGDHVLGYQEVFRPLTQAGETICITYDPYRMDFYITVNNCYYLLTRQGLTQTNRGVLTVRRYYDNLLGVLGPLDDLSGAIVTDAMDLASPETKTLQSVQIGSHWLETMPEVTVSARMTGGASWRTRTGVPNEGGVLVLPVTGREVKVSVAASEVMDWEVRTLQLLLTEGRTRL